MMNRKNKLGVWSLESGVLVLGFMLVSLYGRSQEVLTELGDNPVLIKKNTEIKSNIAKKNPVVLDTLALPFLDDFSKESIYPDPTLWLDSNVFINRDYPIAPPTLGVATFDGVSKTGRPYDTITNNPTSCQLADSLTSKPINLGALSPADSVYLSFYWQAKGRGNDPESSDTLMLQFFNPTTGVWTTQWFKKGYNPSSSDSAFYLVMVPIKDTAYFKSAFQFRFRNRATTSGNVDHWHIDYVYLNNNRPFDDTVFSDVAFAYNSKSLLKNYYAMPWEQYQASEMKSNLVFFIRNNDTVAAGKNTSFGYDIYNNTGAKEASYSGGSDNFYPYLTNGYVNNSPFSNPAIGTNTASPTPVIAYTYPTLTDTASFTLECALNTTPDKDRWNDTLRFKQNFYNYYAYDDGTVEAGYGLNVYGGQIAYKFTLNNPDTLVAVQMLFNWMAPKVSTRQFQIRVWADGGSGPGTLLYEDSLVNPKYQYQFNNTWGNLTNMFYPYKLTIPQKLSGTFYVGLIQYCCNGGTELLNIGYDKNTDASNKMFYNTGSGWNQTALAQKGSWMIRPVFRDTTGLMSIPEPNVTPQFSVYPNPSTGMFNVKWVMGNGNTSAIKHQPLTIKIYNLFGELIQEQTLETEEQSVIMDAPNGVYFLRITDAKGTAYSQKVVIAR